jgi:hypothetical protein
VCPEYLCGREGHLFDRPVVERETLQRRGRHRQDRRDYQWLLIVGIVNHHTERPGLLAC